MWVLGQPIGPAYIFDHAHLEVLGRLSRMLDPGPRRHGASWRAITPWRPSRRAAQRQRDCSRMKAMSWGRRNALHYSCVWEDADVLCQALAPVAQGRRLLSISSAGDNSLALLTLDPSEVVDRKSTRL